MQKGGGGSSFGHQQNAIVSDRMSHPVRLLLLYFLSILARIFVVVFSYLFLKMCYLFVDYFKMSMHFDCRCL